MKLFTLSLSLLLVALCLPVLTVFADEVAPINPSVTLTCPTTFIRGFPAILRLKCTGPQTTPPTNLFTTNQKILVDLVAQDGGKVYSIKSNYFFSGTGIGPMGGMMEITQANIMPLPAEKDYTMLLDLYSLRQQGAPGTTLTDIPNGKYTLQVTLTSQTPQLVTVPQKIEIVAPTTKQQQFLNKVKERYLANAPIYMDNANSPGPISNWAHFLKEPVPIWDEVNKLDPYARGLMGMHVELSELMLFPSDLKTFEAKTWKQLRSVKVPDYLKRDKQCVLLELEILQEGANKHQREIDALLRKDKGLEWRIEKAKKNQTDHQFHRVLYKRLVPQKPETKPTQTP